ncbi:metallophosphoesterase [Niabella terrae]
MSIKRRDFLGRLSKAGLAGALGIPGGAALLPAIQTGSADPEAGHIFLTPPYLQATGPDGICISWITNQLCYSWVEFGIAGKLDQRAHTIHNGMVDANNRINRVQLTGLQPGTKYSYRVVSREIISFKPYQLTYGERITSEVHSFQTMDPEAPELRWLVLNDIHDRPHSFGDLLQLNGSDPYDYVFLNGDMFDYQTGEQQLIDHLLQPCTAVFASRTPFLFVRGNHETRGKFARGIADYFSSPSGHYYYAYRWGPVYHIVLDTGEDKHDDHPVYAGIVDFDGYRREQARWLEQLLQSSECRNAPFRVVMMHIPHFHSGDWHGTLHCRELFAPLFNKYKVDLLLAGHTHKYGVFPPEAGNHEFPIIIGGGPKEGTRTLIKLKANQRQIDLQMIRDDGAKVGTYQVKRR